MPSPSLRRVLLGVLVLTLSTALTACAGEDRVTLRVGDQVKINQSVLEASGQLNGLPYDIEWSSFTAGPPLLEAINADAIDVGGVGDSPPVLAQAAGIRAKIVSAQRRENANDFLLARPGVNIASVADLRGHTVAVAKGSSSHGLLLALLDEGGVPLSAVTVTYLAPPDAQSALAAGQVDAWAVWNPYAAVATAGGARIVADGTTATTQQSYIVAAGGALADGPKSAAIGDFVRRLAAAQDWTAQHPNEWVPIYARLTNLSPEVARTTFTSSIAHRVVIDDPTIARQQQLADRFGKAGVIPAAPDVRAFFDNRFNTGIAP